MACSAVCPPDASHQKDRSHSSYTEADGLTPFGHCMEFKREGEAGADPHRFTRTHIHGVGIAPTSNIATSPPPPQNNYTCMQARS